jgi:hypothetical protein
MEEEPYGSVVSKTFSTTTSHADPLIRKHAIHWVLAQESYATSRRKVIEGWNLVFEKQDMCVYESLDFTIVAFRGTVNSEDFKNDVQLAVAGSKTFAKVQPAIEFVKPYIDGRLIQVTGHSLGGALARHVGQALGLGIVTFNAAAPPSNPAHGGPNEVDYHIVFDIISAWTRPTTVRIDKGHKPYRPSFHASKAWFLGKGMKPMFEAHSLINFSNERYGKIVGEDHENSLWHEWYTKLPLFLKAIFLFFINARKLPPV